MAARLPEEGGFTGRSGGKSEFNLSWKPSVFRVDRVFGQFFIL
jgi:hypothetical protein